MRDVRERGRDIEGIIKQWFNFVKPSYKRYVEPQRSISGAWILFLQKQSLFRWILISQYRHHHSARHREQDRHRYVMPSLLTLNMRLMWSDMVVKHIQRRLDEKSKKHSEELRQLGRIAAEEQLSPNVMVMPAVSQFVAMNTILQDPATEPVDFVFNFDRLAALLIEK